MTPRSTRTLRATALAAVVATATAPLLTTPAATASGPATTAAASSADLGWVTGTVVDTDGKPVKGALVNVLPPREIPELGLLDDRNQRWAVTGADGTFRVRQDERGFLVQVCDAEPDAGATCRYPSDADHLVR